MGSLTTLQALFVEAYCGAANYNASEAARLAGYKDNRHVAKRGAELLKNPLIQAEVDKHIKQRSRCFRIKEDEVLEGLYKEATSTDEKSTQQGRIQAWVHLGKHLGMFREKDKGPQQLKLQIVNYNNNTNVKKIESPTVLEGVIDEVV